MKLLNKQFILSLVIMLSALVLFTIVTADSRVSTKQGELYIGSPENGQGFRIANQTNTNNSTITSKIYNLDFPFNAVAFTWEQDSDVEFEAYLRFKKENWSEWEKSFISVDLKDPNVITKTTQLQFSPYTNILQYKLVFNNPDDIKKIKNLKLVYIDSTKGGQRYVKIANATESLKIISRKEWGADESYRFDETGQEKWPIEFYTPKKIVIHHTASTDISDGPATVRAIYYWHSVSNDWGDIGYNYLIDAQGNVYEGRAGGDGAVGAHAYMENRNTIGIAILGCFQPGEKNCNTPNSLTPETKASLEKLIAVKSQLFNINPTASSDFNERTNIPNVLGHKDVGHTNCPGDIIYNQLSLIKNESNIKLASLSPMPLFNTSAELISVSQNNIEIPLNQTGQVIVKFKNTGMATWRGYADDGLIVGNNVKKYGRIDGFKFANYNQSTIEGFKMKEGNVKPGETGTFILDLPSETTTKTFTLAWDSKGYFPNTDFIVNTQSVASVVNTDQIITNVIPLTYKALLEKYNLPSDIPLNTKATGSLKFRNIGTGTLNGSDLKLQITLKDGSTSPLIPVTSFPAGGSLVEQQSIVFDIPYEVATQKSTLEHTIKLIYQNQELLSLRYAPNIISSYSGTITQENFPIAIKTTWRPTVTMTIKNVGSQDWVNPTLKSTDVDGTLSWFFDWSWQDKKTIQTKKLTVKTGEEVTFKFKIKPYWKPSSYPHVYKLWTGSENILLNGQELYERTTRVDR